MLPTLPTSKRKNEIKAISAVFLNYDFIYTTEYMVGHGIVLLEKATVMYSIRCYALSGFTEARQTGC